MKGVLKALVIPIPSRPSPPLCESGQARRPPPGAGDTADDALFEKRIRFGERDSNSGFIITNLSLQPDEGFLSGVRTRLRALSAPPRSKSAREDADSTWMRLHYTLESVTASSQETLLGHLALLHTNACGVNMGKVKGDR